MTYTTEQDMVDRFGQDELIQLTDRSNTGAIDTTVLDDAIADAGNEIDSYLGGRYTLPLSTVPPVLNRVCAEIARYRLYTFEAPAEVANRYKANTQWLTQVANGVIQLGVDAVGAQPADAVTPPNPPARVFTYDTLKDF